MHDTLQAVADRLASATTYAEVFGAIAAQDMKMGERQLRRQYVAIAQMVHPDHVPHAKDDAGAVTAQLNLFYERAKAALAAGVYAQSFTAAQGAASSASRITIETATGRYAFEETPMAQGDFSSIRQGVSEDGTPVFAKVANDPSLNQYLATEAAVLQEAQQNATAKTVLPFLPELLDSAQLIEDGNMQYRVNIFRFAAGYVSITQIRDAYPDGLKPEEAAWVWRRIIGQTLAAATLGYVHGAIVPDHVLVHPTTHDPLHIGWAHAVSQPQQRHARITTIMNRWRDWYPPEVLARQIPSHQTDLYMAGKTMLYLLGGDTARNRFPSHVPDRFTHLIARCLEDDPSRRGDGQTLMRASTEVIRKLWGRSYRQLIMPAK